MPLNPFAELQSYQQPQTGMALTGQQPATMPPASPAEFQQRQQGWMNTFNEMLSNPVASTMLLQAGMSLLGGGTGGEAVGDAFGAVGRGMALQDKQRQQDFANQLAQGRFELDQEELDLRRQQLGMQQQLMQQRLARGAGGGGGGGGRGAPDENAFYEKALAAAKSMGLDDEAAAKWAQDATTAKFLGKGALGRPGKPEKTGGLEDMSLQDLNEAILVESDPDVKAAYKAERMRRLGMGGAAAVAPPAGLPTNPVPSSTEYGRNPPPTRAPSAFQPNPAPIPSRSQQGRPVEQPQLQEFFRGAGTSARALAPRTAQGRPSDVLSFNSLDDANAAAIAGKIPSGSRVFVNGREVIWRD